MAGFWMGEGTQDRIDLWLTRALVLLSFAAHLTLAILAGIRRRRDSGVRRSLVWLAYHLTEIGTPIALGKVFLDNTTADSEQQLLVAFREQQMFAFWAPFLLLHLGRPDNITSYALENKELSPTQKAALVLGIGGAIYGSYKQRFMRGDGTLRAAFFIMLFLASYKYVERAVALHRASFANIRRSKKKTFKRHFTFGIDGSKRDNDDTLLDAHGLLGVTMGAFADYRYDHGTHVPPYSDWKGVSKVVEMEASLMYDMLYTKASVIHTWGGYIIRVLSPPATATALYLLRSKEGQAMESADRTITYILLVGTLVLDVIWLLRALGSTWTYAFLFNTERAGRRAGRQSWYWLRRLLVSLDPSRLSLRSGLSGHRLLPGSGVGQRNLLHEGSTPGGRLEKVVSFFAGLGKEKIDVKDELLEVMCTHLVFQTDWKVRMHPTGKVDDYMRSNADKYSFESNLIALHVATDIFLLCRPTWPGIESEASARYGKQIRALSDYMIFLLAQRQHMVLKLGDEGSDYKRACLALKELWREKGTSGSRTTRDTKLASILLKMNATEVRRYRSPEEKLYDNSSLLSDSNKTLKLGADWALKLLQEVDPTYYGSEYTVSVGIFSPAQSVHRLEDFIPVFTDEAQTKIKGHRDRGEQSDLLDYVLQLILLSWARLLTFTSIQCSRESHAKQLSCGGELLTIAWLMNKHGEQPIFFKIV